MRHPFRSGGFARQPRISANSGSSEERATGSRKTGNISNTSRAGVNHFVASAPLNVSKSDRRRRLERDALDQGVRPAVRRNRDISLPRKTVSVDRQARRNTSQPDCESKGIQALRFSDSSAEQENKMVLTRLQGSIQKRRKKKNMIVESESDCDTSKDKQLDVITPRNQRRQRKYKKKELCTALDDIKALGRDVLKEPGGMRKFECMWAFRAFCRECDLLYNAILTGEEEFEFMPTDDQRVLDAINGLILRIGLNPIERDYWMGISVAAKLKDLLLTRLPKTGAALYFKKLLKKSFAVDKRPINREWDKKGYMIIRETV